MKVIPFQSPATQRQLSAELAAQLRRLAGEIERGELRQVVITAIYPDGRIERLGDIPTVTKLT